jgi:hypothetical protein
LWLLPGGVQAGRAVSKSCQDTIDAAPPGTFTPAIRLVQPFAEPEGGATVTAAEADLVGSATLVAVTVNAPAELGAVYSPEVLTVPPVADQVTEVFELPVTVTENCKVALVSKAADVGLMVTDTTGGGAVVTVTDAEADFVVSATLVAVTV